MSKAEKTGKKSIKTLRADPDNARTIKTKAQDGLRTSTKKFGDLSGIVFNEKSGDLVTGHQRVATLRRAGATDWIRESATAGYILHPETSERFNIRIVKWGEVMARAANIAANNSEIAGEYTDEAIDQIAALEAELGNEFQDLAFGGLAATLEKELRKATRNVHDDSETAGSDNVSDDFMIVIECTSEKHQRELIERFVDEGLKCRALT